MEEGQEFLLALLLVGDPDRLGVGERDAPFADLSLLVFGQGPQPVFEPIEGGMGPLLEPLRRGGLHEARGFGVVLLQGCFEGAHLAGIDGGEEDAAVGDDPVEEVGAQAIVGGIDPVEILAGEPPFESLPDLQEEAFILRNGFVPVPGQQWREPLGQVVALVNAEIEVVIDLPEDEPVGIAIDREDRAAGEEDQQPGGTPRPPAVPPSPRLILCRAVGHDACAYVLKSPALIQGEGGEEVLRAEGGDRTE
ncbi:MAG: hypothetical protein EWM72_00013 [Nitrospira sp.]|nr:MAG: hypothetical protein EWM72_00013 [Nitrospira sp.]